MAHILNVVHRFLERSKKEIELNVQFHRETLMRAQNKKQN